MSKQERVLLVLIASTLMAAVSCGVDRKCRADEDCEPHTETT